MRFWRRVFLKPLLVIEKFGDNTGLCCEFTDRKLFRCSEKQIFF